ncbi:UNVERIFIED_ORG: isoaspartyl dipeptidase IadA [Bacillus sp. B2I3]|nr:isoaspartyl dipeptidase IadA [Bacillus sp. B2I3]
MEYAKKGGYIDFTTSTIQKFLEEGEVKASTAIKMALEEGVEIGQITITSDGQASLPDFDGSGNLRGLNIGTCMSLYDCVVDAVLEDGVAIADALRVVTENPANILKLSAKGKLSVGKDADIIMMNQRTLEINSVIAMGQMMVKDGHAVVKGTFEK